ncbi:sugar transferase [Arthrobacter gandavensis]|uniref:sugar transferase n=1 Tax=Arthrobacter gandavensis TaxID=169960 RepID=UPI00188F02ED|nr:sugar transferase [Arthrobacter gandavensis]MBF4993019.1 sugar transferase [Arthrobacter gandavensis]
MNANTRRLLPGKFLLGETNDVVDQLQNPPSIRHRTVAPGHGSAEVHPQVLTAQGVHPWGFQTTPSAAITQVPAAAGVGGPAVSHALQPFEFPSFIPRSSNKPQTSRTAAVLRNRRYALILIFTDALVISSALLGGTVARFGTQTAELRVGTLATTYWVLSFLLGAGWMLALHAYRSRDPRIAGIGTDEYKRVVNAAFAATAGLVFASFVLQLDIARGYFAYVLPAGTVGLLCSRWIVRQWLRRQRQRGRFLSRVVVLGRPRDVRYVIHQISTDAGAPYKVMGVALTGKFRSSLEVDGQLLPVVSDSEHVVDAVTNLGADAVIVAGPTKGGSRYVQELGWKLEESAVQLILATGLTNVAGPRIHTRPVEGLPLMHVELPQYAGGKHLLKRALDVVLSGLALLALMPVFLVLALLVRRDSPGPVLFRQERVGRGGEVFEMLKFRSMVQTAEDDLAGLLDRNEGSGLLFKMQHDPRVTQVGRWMRKYSLDELPQFWNVFLGNMSLVGPRPPLPREVARYGGRVHRRLYIKPGLTGMWQINGRSELNWKDGVRLDLYYVENWSVAGDLIILWRTAKMLLRPVGAY